MFFLNAQFLKQFFLIICHFLSFYLLKKYHSERISWEDRKFIKPFGNLFTLAVMNTSPKYASAKVLSKVLKETLFKGKKTALFINPMKIGGSR